MSFKKDHENRNIFRMKQLTTKQESEDIDNEIQDLIQDDENGEEDEFLAAYQSR